MDRFVAGVTLEAAVAAGITLADLAVVEFDEVAQRLDPIDGGVGQLQVVEPALPAGPPDRVELRDDALFAEGLMDLLLQAGTEPAQLGP